MGGKIVFSDFEKGTAGKRSRTSLYSHELGIVKLELVINAPVISDPKKFHAALLADLVRIRGVDYDALGRSFGFKKKIPQGWHQNIEYPNHPKDGRHDSLDLGLVVDLMDFSRKICSLWNIEWQEAGNQKDLFQ